MGIFALLFFTMVYDSVERYIKTLLVIGICVAIILSGVALI